MKSKTLDDLKAGDVLVCKSWDEFISKRKTLSDKGFQISRAMTHDLAICIEGKKKKSRG